MMIDTLYLSDQLVINIYTQILLAKSLSATVIIPLPVFGTYPCPLVIVPSPPKSD
jgi:hypothetical protein